MTFEEIDLIANANPNFKRYAREFDLATPWFFPVAMTRGYLNRWYGDRPYMTATQRRNLRQNEWIRVKDELPQAHQPVMCWVDHGYPRGWAILEYHRREDQHYVFEAGFYAGDDTSFRIYADERIRNVTHWMPLPAAPKAN